jgi:hypothetical protein
MHAGQEKRPAGLSFIRHVLNSEYNTGRQDGGYRTVSEDHQSTTINKFVFQANVSFKATEI